MIPLLRPLPSVGKDGRWPKQMLAQSDLPQLASTTTHNKFESLSPGRALLKGRCRSIQGLPQQVTNQYTKNLSKRIGKAGQAADARSQNPNTKHAFCITMRTHTHQASPRIFCPDFVLSRLPTLASTSRAGRHFAQDQWNATCQVDS